MFFQFQFSIVHCNLRPAQAWLMYFTRFSPYDADFWEWEVRPDNLQEGMWLASPRLDASTRLRFPATRTQCELALEISNRIATSECKWLWTIVSYKAELGFVVALSFHFTVKQRQQLAYVHTTLYCTVTSDLRLRTPGPLTYLYCCQVLRLSLIAFHLPAEQDSWHAVALDDVACSADEEEAATSFLGSLRRAAARPVDHSSAKTSSKQHKVGPGGWTSSTLSAM